MEINSNLRAGFLFDACRLATWLKFYYHLLESGNYLLQRKTMIGNFLREDEKTENAEQNVTDAEVKRADDVLSIPKVQDFEPQSEENRDEISVFRESGEVIEAVPLPENQESYTVAPSDAIISGQNQELLKTQITVETPEVNLRRTGLAWSAATVLGGSVVFMLILGWFFDLVFGSKPWGVVGGIVLGAVIGFIQFFRITSQIFKKDDDNSLGIN